jgi:hypothetical protein
MDDVQQAAEALEGVDFALFKRSKGTGAGLRGEFVHESVIALGKAKLKQRSGSDRGKFPLELNHTLPNRRTTVGSQRLGVHAHECTPATVATEWRMEKAGANIGFTQGKSKTVP